MSFTVEICSTSQTARGYSGQLGFVPLDYFGIRQANRIVRACYRYSKGNYGQQNPILLSDDSASIRIWKYPLALHNTSGHLAMKEDFRCNAA